MRAAADPFAERATARRRRLRLSLLGGRFEFVSEEPRLLALVRWAYAGLPAHRIGATSSLFRVHLRLAPGGGRTTGPTLFSGAGLLGAASGGSDIVLLAPELRSALIVVTEAILSTPYLVRYELIEFAVCTLAARAQGLVALHAAAIGRGGRGLLLVGDSGAGKSTLTAQAALDRFDVLSEDSVFVAPRTLRATGIANFLHLRPESLPLLPPDAAKRIARSPMITRRSGVRKYEMDLRAPGFRPAPRAPRLAAMILVSSRPASRSGVLRRVSTASALARLRRSQPYAAAQPTWESFARRAATLEAYELRRTASPLDAVQALRELLP